MLPLDLDQPPVGERTVGTADIRTLDLFAGAGGLTAGMHEASSRFTPARAVEHDVEAAASFAQNFGEVVYVGGIEQWLEDEQVPQVDVVIGGPPCQGFSTLGKQQVDDHRNFLWRQYVETVCRAQPRFFVLENVPAFTRSPQFEVFRDATQRGGDLEDYAFEPFVLNAADYGAPQARRRVIVLGRRRDEAPLGPPSPSHRGRHTTVREALAGISPGRIEVELPFGKVEFAGKRLPGAFRAADLHLGRLYTELSMRRFRSIPYGGNRFDLPYELQAPCWRKHTTGSGDVMGRLVWDAPSVTIRTEFFKPEKGRYLHPTQHRAITHFEAARIQGFPDDYLFVGSKTSIARQIGNAVPIPLGKAIGQHLLNRFSE